MKFIGNILWLILGGLLVSLGYFIAGLLYCVTIIGRAGRTWWTGTTPEAASAYS